MAERCQGTAGGDIIPSIAAAARFSISPEVLEALHAVSHGVLLLHDGTITFANRAACRLVGADDLAGRSLDSLLGPEDARTGRVVSREPDLPRELSLLRADGSPVFVQAFAVPVLADGVSLDVVSLVDVGPRREAEEARRSLAELTRRQEAQLEHSTRLAELGEMAASISHELNQPLTGIRNYARNAFYMLEQTPGAEAEVKNNLRLISEQVDRAAKIINQMRELTRRTDSAFVVLDVNSVVRESVEFILPQMKLSEVEVSLDLADRLPPVWGDRIRLEQVFLNLLSNARQAMGDATVRRLVVRSQREGAPAPGVVVQVTDTGRGFSDEQARQLFQPFYTTRKGGHGLGLSISRAIVLDHKGSLEARGVPGQGATFTVRLPVAPGESAAGGRS